MVRLFKDTLGRGPRRGRAHFADPQTLVVLLEGTMTVAERNLAAMGEHKRLRESRMFVQSALEDEARAIVERGLRRPTIAFITGVDPERDVALQFFTLAG